MTAGRPLAPERWTEAQLEAEIVALIAARGLYLKSHGPDDRRDKVSNPGWPDFVIVGPGGILFRENKRHGEDPSPEQRRWGHVLTASGADWAVWRPLDLASGRIEVELDALTVRGTPRTLTRPMIGLLKVFYAGAIEAGRLARFPATMGAFLELDLTDGEGEAIRLIRVEFPGALEDSPPGS